MTMMTIGLHLPTDHPADLIHLPALRCQASCGPPPPQPVNLPPPQKNAGGPPAGTPTTTDSEGIRQLIPTVTPPSTSAGRALCLAQDLPLDTHPISPAQNATFEQNKRDNQRSPHSGTWDLPGPITPGPRRRDHQLRTPTASSPHTLHAGAQRKQPHPPPLRCAGRSVPSLGNRGLSETACEGPRDEEGSALSPGQVANEEAN